MKTLTNCLGLFAASAVVFGTMAYAQAPTVKAEIPFAFRTANANLPAGSYIVTQDIGSNGVHVTRLRNVASRKSVMALGGPVEHRATGAPAMTFECGSEGCALASIRTSDGTTAYHVNRAKPGRKEVAIVNVPLLTANGD